MADYGEDYQAIRAAGAEVAAVSVDPPPTSERVRRELRLPFPILCDTDRRVVKEWDIYNPKERGGIAKPSVFLIGSDRAVGFSQLDDIARRLPPSEIIRILVTGKEQPLRNKTYIPRFGDIFRALRSYFRR